MISDLKISMKEILEHFNLMINARQWSVVIFAHSSSNHPRLVSTMTRSALSLLLETLREVGPTQGCKMLTPPGCCFAVLNASFILAHGSLSYKECRLPVPASNELHSNPPGCNYRIVIHTEQDSESDQYPHCQHPETCLWNHMHQMKLLMVRRRYNDFRGLFCTHTRLYQGL